MTREPAVIELPVGPVEGLRRHRRDIRYLVGALILLAVVITGMSVAFYVSSQQAAEARAHLQDRINANQSYIAQLQACVKDPNCIVLPPPVTTTTTTTTPPQRRPTATTVRRAPSTTAAPPTATTTTTAAPTTTTTARRPSTTTTTCSPPVTRPGDGCLVP